jgi:hypothetical protein
MIPKGIAVHRRPARGAGRGGLSAAALAIVAALPACSDDPGDPCALEDQDGIIGGQDVFVLRVDDDAFDPIILAAQNRSDVTLTLENLGTAPAGFSVDCLPTPNDDGCAEESCFPAGHAIAPIPPGASATVQFQLPEVEGAYVYRAAPGDTRTGQFILQ